LCFNTAYSPSSFKEGNGGILLPFSEVEKRMSSSFQLKYRTPLRETVRLKLKKSLKKKKKIRRVMQM